MMYKARCDKCGSIAEFVMTASQIDFYYCWDCQSETRRTMTVDTPVTRMTDLYGE
jgi:predicted nucleic acid-binding Zn ribbon protein